MYTSSHHRRLLETVSCEIICIYTCVFMLDVGDRVFPSSDVLDTEFVVHILVCRCEIIWRQEESYGRALSSHRRSIHHLILGNRLRLCVCIRPGASALSPANLQLHVLDPDPHQQKIDLTHYNILQMILTLRVLKLDMQTVFNTNLHLDTVIHLRRR